MRKINEIIVHTLATPKGWMVSKTDEQKLAEVRRWHVKERGWSDIGYHFIVFRDGRVLEGRPVAKAGAHTKGRNANSIGIALEGGKGHNRTEPFSAVYTVKQGKALARLISKMNDEYGVVELSPHNKYSSKECPAFDFYAWLDDLAIEMSPSVPYVAPDVEPAPQPVLPPDMPDPVPEDINAQSAARPWDTVLNAPERSPSAKGLGIGAGAAIGLTAFFAALGVWWDNLAAFIGGIFG